MALRVIQWATGGVGRAAVQGVLAHPDLELVGCWVHSEDKVGRDVGELCGRDAIGLTATGDVDALLALEADCVIYAPILADPAMVARILRSGADVVTPLNWFFAEGRDESLIEAACAEGGATIHGTGIHPGGVTERIPLLVSALSQSITHVRAEEFSDIRSYGAPAVVGDIMLFGRTPQEAEASMMPAILGDGFLQSVAMLGHELGMALDPEPRVHHEVALATAPIDSPDRADRAGPGGRAEVLLGGHGAGRAGDHGAHQLVHGPGASRSAVVVRARGRALRDRGDR